MRLHAIIAASIPTLLALGCATTPPATSDGQLTGSSADHTSLFPADRTATLWVKGLACPY
jgi:hypothetical protein